MGSKYNIYNLWGLNIYIHTSISWTSPVWRTPTSFFSCFLCNPPASLILGNVLYLYLIVLWFSVCPLFVVYVSTVLLFLSTEFGSVCEWTLLDSVLRVFLMFYCCLLSWFCLLDEMGISWGWWWYLYSAMAAATAASFVLPLTSSTSTHIPICSNTYKPLSISKRTNFVRYMPILLVCFFF